MSDSPTLYEAMYILNTELPEDEAAAVIAQLESIVTEAGGEVVGTRDFRVRKLAFEIDGHTSGAYKLLYFRGDGSVVQMLREEMAILQPIIRSRVFLANPDAIVAGDADVEEREMAAEAAEAAEAAQSSDEAPEQAATAEQ